MIKIVSNLIKGLNVPKIIKSIKGNNNQVKAIKDIAVGGTLALTTGIGLVTDGVVNKDYHSILGGAILLAVWLFLVERMGNKISEIK